jgi:hypothetical protein
LLEIESLPSKLEAKFKPQYLKKEERERERERERRI